MATPTLTQDARRQAAAARMASVALPEFKGKDGWEFTPLGKLDLDALPPAPGGSTDGVELLLDPEGAVALSSDVAVSEGPLVMRLGDAIEQHPELVGAHLGTVVDPGSALVVRNDERWSDGAFVYVPRNVAVDAPILISHVHEQTGTALYTRTLVVLEEGAEAEVWDQTVCAGPETEGLVNGVVELVVGPTARLRGSMGGRIAPCHHSLLVSEERERQHLAPIAQTLKPLDRYEAVDDAKLEHQRGGKIEVALLAIGGGNNLEDDGDHAGTDDECGVDASRRKMRSSRVMNRSRLANS